MAGRRLFVGLKLPREIHEAAAALLERLSPLAPRAKWVDPDRLHLTLLFLGSCDAAQTLSAQTGTLTVASRHAPFELRLTGGGSFGRKGHPRVLWVGVEGALTALESLQADVQETLGALQQKPEHRAYRAHLTLARAREERGDASLARCAESLQAVALGVTAVTHLTLFESRLTPDGPVYEPLCQAKLATPSGAGPSAS